MRISAWSSDVCSSDLPPPPLLAPDNIEHWPGQLRRYRIAGSLAMIVADVADPHAIDHVLRHTSELPDRCIAAALSAVQADMAPRHVRGCDHHGDHGRQSAV